MTWPAGRPPTIYAGVLIGGASRRMGENKSLLRLEGTTFAQRVITAVRGLAERVVLLGDGPVPPLPPEVVRLPDVPGISGPLAGMLAAMRWAPDRCWLFAACDLPLLRAEALEWLVDQRQPGHWVVLPKLTPERVEPLLAVYEPEALRLLEKLVGRGCLSPSRLAGERNVFTPTPPESLCDCWTNVNTPEQYRRLEPEAEGAVTPLEPRGCPGRRACGGTAHRTEGTGGAG